MEVVNNNDNIILSDVSSVDTTTTGDQKMTILCQVRSPSFEEENDVFFSSLYAQLDKDKEVSKKSKTKSPPDLTILVGEGKLEAHLIIMKHFCDKFSVAKKEEGTESKGRTGHILCVPDNVGVSLEAFKIFRKAIYLKELQPTILDTWLEVRRLGEYFGCQMVLDKCDDVEISDTNCNVVFDKWPEGSLGQTRALDFVKCNLKALIDTDKYLDWRGKTWLSALALNDLPPPIPSEDDLCRAILKWEDKNRSRVDVSKFRSLIKDLLRYPLMSEEFLLDRTFRDSGLLSLDELVKIYAEKKGVEATTFNRSPRMAIADASRVPLRETSMSSASTDSLHTDAPGAVYSPNEDNTGGHGEGDVHQSVHEEGEDSSAVEVQDQSDLLVARTNGTVNTLPPTLPLSVAHSESEDGHGRPQMTNSNPVATPPLPLDTSTLGRPNRLIANPTHPDLTRANEQLVETNRPLLNTSGVLVPRGILKKMSRRNPQKLMVGDDHEAVRSDEVENNEAGEPRRSQRKRPRSKSDSRERATSKSQTMSNGHAATVTKSLSTKRPPSNLSLPLTPTQKSQKSVANNFKQLKTILDNVTTGQEIKLSAGIFNFSGELDMKNLPGGVKFRGAGPGKTVIRAPKSLEYIWGIDAKKQVTIENMTFERQDADRRDQLKGLWITSEGIRIHNVSFVGCHLELTDCDGAEVTDVTVESSSFGMILDQKTKNVEVRNPSFTNIAEGIKIKGRGNKIAHVGCVDVGMGVVFDGEGNWKKHPCKGNSLVGLSYTFGAKDVEQTAVKMLSADNNVVENVNCLGYRAMKAGQKKASCLWITKHTKSSATPANNVAKELSGGPVWITGDRNRVQDLRDCAFLHAMGSDHQFTNCVVGSVKFQETSNIVKTNCNF